MNSIQIQELQSHHHAKLMALGEMSATIVHEIRNALTTVLLGLNAMNSHELGEYDQIKVRLSLSEAERIQRLVTQLLQFSKPTSSERSLIELNFFLENIIESQRMIFASDINAIHYYPSQKNLTILMNVDKLKQILINLIANACEASPCDEIVTCRVRDIQQSDGICIEIHNWGKPIPPELINQVTQPYITTKSNGNGLGLFIVQQLIQEQEGQLHIQSDVAQGTFISVTFPHYA